MCKKCHFDTQNFNKKTSLPWEGGHPLPHPLPARSLRSSLCPPVEKSWLRQCSCFKECQIYFGGKKSCITAKAISFDIICDRNREQNQEWNEQNDDYELNKPSQSGAYASDFSSSTGCFWMQDVMPHWAAPALKKKSLSVAEGGRTGRWDFDFFFFLPPKK